VLPHEPWLLLCMSAAGPPPASTSCWLCRPAGNAAAGAVRLLLLLACLLSAWLLPVKDTARVWEAVVSVLLVLLLELTTSMVGLQLWAQPGWCVHAWDFLFC